MGTNYYHRTLICKHCNRYDERHIGKSSAGWQFYFQGYNGDGPQIASFERWLMVFDAGGEIFDEYGKKISVDGFLKIVTNRKGKVSEDGQWVDSQGYVFTSREFS